MLKNRKIVPIAVIALVVSLSSCGGIQFAAPGLTDLTIKLTGDESCQPINISVVSDPDKILLPISDSNFEMPKNLTKNGKTVNGTYIISQRATSKSAEAVVQLDCMEISTVKSSINAKIKYQPGIFLPPVVINIDKGVLTNIQ